MFLSTGVAERNFSAKPSTYAPKGLVWYAVIEHYMQKTLLHNVDRDYSIPVLPANEKNLHQHNSIG